jgi:hypothetical protein
VETSADRQDGACGRDDIFLFPDIKFSKDESWRRKRRTLNLLRRKTKKGTALQVLQQCPFVLQKKVGCGKGRASVGDEDRSMGTTVFEYIAGERGGFYILSVA